MLIKSDWIKKSDHGVNVGIVAHPKPNQQGHDVIDQKALIKFNQEWIILLKIVIAKNN